MKRREFITLLGGAAVAASRPARASGPQKAVDRNTDGICGSRSDISGAHGGVQLAFERLVSGRKAATATDTYRFGFGDRSDPRLRQELVDLKPDRDRVRDAPTLTKAADGNNSDHICFGHRSPSATALSPTLARPGGNITGFTNFEATNGRQADRTAQGTRPGSRRVGVISTRKPRCSSAVGRVFLKSAAASALGVAVFCWLCRSRSDDIASAFRGSGAAGSAPYWSGWMPPRPCIAGDHCAGRRKARVAAIFPGGLEPPIGGLVAYGVEVSGPLLRRAAAYVDRILKGTKAGDLPVEQPTKLELIINLKAAKALGLNVPPTLLATADESDRMILPHCRKRQCRRFLLN